MMLLLPSPTCTTAVGRTVSQEDGVSVEVSMHSFFSVHEFSVLRRFGADGFAAGESFASSCKSVW